VTGMVEGKTVVLSVPKDSEAARMGVLPGYAIVEVDGESTEARIAAIRMRQTQVLNERSNIESAAREILHGECGKSAQLILSAPIGGSTITVELSRRASSPSYTFLPSFPVTKLSFIWYGRHPSGLGYIRVLSFNGRMEIADEFDKALEELKDTPGLVLDIRDNTGGFGNAQLQMVGRFIHGEYPSIIGYRRNGPKHTDFNVSTGMIRPAGSWHYLKPLAFLINPQTGSASDLFAARLIGTGRPVTIGENTRGNLTGHSVHVILPCGFTVRVSDSYVADKNGRVIEGNGNAPDILLEPTLDDIAQGRDAVLDRAVLELKNRIGATKMPE
jgi:carboxyl-terminal processing protease